MPLYEFKCIKCEEKIEEFQATHDEHKATCPKCGKPARRVYGFGGFQIDFRPGFDPGLGQYVDTKRQRDNYIAENGLRRMKD